MTTQRQQQSAPHTTITHWLFLIIIATLAITVDQASKAYVVAHLDLHESWMPLDFIEPVFKFTHVHNTGAAFGLFPDGGTVFFVIALVVSVVIVYYYRKLPGQVWLMRLALGLQLGGAVSNNLIDRVRLGYVVDFFNVTYWPVFNVADSCIVLGVALLALELLREEWRDARDKAERHQAAFGAEEVDNNLPESPEEQAYG